MTAPAASPANKTVERRLGKLRRRAGRVYALRAIAAAAGAGGSMLVVLALLVGPVATLPWAVVSWTLIAATAGTAGWLASKPLRELRGPRAATLLRSTDARLASEARSAVELGSDPGAARLAPELVQAHADHTRDALDRLRPATVVPWRGALHPITGAGVAAALVAASLVLGLDRGSAGTWALLHPGERDDSGIRLAAVVEHTTARLTYPAYMGRNTATRNDPAGIEAPRGTNIDYRVQPQVEAVAAQLHVAGRKIRLEQTDNSGFRGRFVARQGGPIRIRIRRRDGTWLADAQRRWLHVVPDQSPRVSLQAPQNDRTVELQQALSVQYHARDDVGLRRVQLIAQLPGDREVRRSLADFQPEQHETQTQGSTTLIPAEIGARRGDRLKVWVEAEDGDVVSGPNSGKSESRTLTVASEATRRLKRIADIERALDRGLEALADRLEQPPPEASDEAQSRHAHVHDSGEHFVEALRKLAAGIEDGTPGGASDPSVYRAMAKRVERKMRRESQAYRDEPPRLRRRKTLDDALVKELEKDDLLLADLVGEARLQDVAQLAKKLDELRREMTSLLEELRRTTSDEARQKLMAALARAESRMRELMQRIGQMGKDVPSGFVNTDALPQRKSKKALDAMREALDQGDLEAAQRELNSFKHRIRSIAESLGKAETSFAKARFGPREKALAEAMDTLAGLEAEQQRLARRSSKTRQQAARRALEDSGMLGGKQKQELLDKASKAHEALDSLPRASLGPMEKEAFKRARQRLIDSKAALESGDLGEARRMAQRADKQLDQLARDLELSALMFPGQKGRTSKAARQARKASDTTQELRDRLDETLPNVSDYVDAPGKKQMRADARRQRKTRRKAKELAEQLAEGPGETPLAPDASRRVREARESMGKAQRALERSNPLDASRKQQQAARRLTELREDLEKSRRSRQRASGGSGRQGGREGARGGGPMQRRVRIPGAQDHQSPTELRRKLLDAMRESPPEEYAEPVKKYYRELLQ